MSNGKPWWWRYKIARRAARWRRRCVISAPRPPGLLAVLGDVQPAASRGSADEGPDQPGKLLLVDP
jgi:hypothetical protein